MDETNVRGFVFKIEIGRAGLVQVEIVQADGSRATFVIEDLDADPERFNERLSMLAILRDAMNRAEPVEIEAVQGERGLVIDRVARITRDALDPSQKIDQITGMVVELLVFAENRPSSSSEEHDRALVGVLTTSMQTVVLLLDLQAPERLVVTQQLEMLRDAEATGRMVRFLVDNAAERETQARIVALSLDDDMSAFGGDQAHDIDGFVEAVSLIRTSFGASLVGSLAVVRLTTAPPFTGAGNVTSLSPFTPVTIELLTPKNSPTYDLFVAGLRDNRRMRVRMVAPPRRDSNDSGSDTSSDTPRVAVRGLRLGSAAVSSTAAATPAIALAFAAELLAPLASASRPVWISIARESLDHGPDGYPSTPGLPTSDLTPLTLRDLHIPYPASWRGLGCFNDGVYRFQLQLPSTYRLRVDDKELPLYPSDTVGVMFAHACLCGDHTVVVEIDEWTCDNEFLLDVYRLR